MTLPGDTVVKTGHGEDTTIAAELCHVLLGPRGSLFAGRPRITEPG